MRFISTSLFFAILTLLLHVTAAAPLPQGPHPTPSQEKTFWQRPYQKWKLWSHERQAGKQNNKASKNFDRAQQHANDPNLSQMYQDRVDGHVSKRTRHLGKVGEYKGKLQAG
jgi:hypothetical protein